MQQSLATTPRHLSQCVPEQLDCGPVVIGTSLRRVLTLVNNCNCSLQFRLAVEQVVEEDRGGKEVVSLGQRPHGEYPIYPLIAGVYTAFIAGLELSCVEGELKPKSQQTMHIILRPSKPALIRSVIKYQLHHHQSQN